jgi:hypothetical protein
MRSFHSCKTPTYEAKSAQLAAQNPKNVFLTPQRRRVYLELLIVFASDDRAPELCIFAVSFRNFWLALASQFPERAVDPGWRGELDA